MLERPRNPQTTDPVRRREPDWLGGWKTEAISSEAALVRFDSLAPLDPPALIGRWRGSELPIGHPFDGLLSALGWYGKAFRSQDEVDPLLFTTPSGQIVAVNPALIPAAVAMRFPRLARSKLVRLTFRRSLGLLSTSRPTARLRRVDFRGKASAAMIYDRQPITDHYRRIDADRVLGLVDWRGMSQPLFFLLEREPLAA